jgi:hypothetical protein
MFFPEEGGGVRRGAGRCRVPTVELDEIVGRTVPDDLAVPAYASPTGCCARRQSMEVSPAELVRVRRTLL